MKYLLMLMLAVLLPCSLLAQPDYRTTKTRRVDGGGAKRVVVYVTVGAGLSTGQVHHVIEDVVMRHFEDHAITVSVSEHGAAPSGFTVAMGIWAPHGKWARASEGKSDPDRDTYKLSVKYRDQYFARTSTPAWPAEYGLTWEQVNRLAGELQAACMAAVNGVYEKYPAGNVAAADRARDAAIKRVAGRHNMTARQAKRIWDRYLAETL